MIDDAYCLFTKYRYENIVQIRCLLEGVTVEDMLDNWHSILPEYMKTWNLDRNEVRKKEKEQYLLSVYGYQ